ncbi:HEAT repeat domain-containing protein [Actinophytocola xanthii]|uniref:Uncharacterized protein n=1 Tax=Actinophytocola xanthii TaxID=1912961 RepID=A0A1Q8CM40_9PSEU|nr:hypothetical protein [Actinophytocola xanthii]OLF15420.1 hypothetical protein BU204_21895 [Actinophytocola xanthii]
MTESELFESFRAGLYDPLRLTRDAVDEIPNVGAVHLLTGNLRRAAEDLLITRLAVNDGRAASALARLCVTRAIPALRDRIGPDTPHIMRVFAARALHELGDESGREVGPALLGDLGVSEIDRSRAAALMREFPDADREALLVAAEHDPSRLVRSSATDALYANTGLTEPNQERTGETLSSIASRLVSHLTALRGPAANELREILAALDRGASPADLGLLWEPEPDGPLRTFTDAVTSDLYHGQRPDPNGPEYPVEIVAGLTERERRVAEDVLLIYLAHDPRAARAVARLGLAAAVPALRELATWPDLELSTAARAALRTMGVPEHIDRAGP